MTPVTDPQGRGRTDALLNYLSSERDVVVGVCVWYRLFNVDSGNHGSLLPSRRPKSKPSAPMSSCWTPWYRRGATLIPGATECYGGAGRGPSPVRPRALRPATRWPAVCHSDGGPWPIPVPPWRGGP